MLRSSVPFHFEVISLKEIPLSTLAGAGGAVVEHDVDGITLTTDPRQWAYSATIRFDIPDIDRLPRAICIRVDVRRGVLGAGWLSADGAEWVARGSVPAGTGVREIRIEVPAGTEGGMLVFDNWTSGGRPAVAALRRIELLDVPSSQPVTLVGSKSSRAEECASHVHAAIAAEEARDPQLAITEYKAALASDPAHVGARASLGRLQFVAPEQPFLDEMRSRGSFDLCQVTLEIRNPCNYRCFYCVAAGHNDVPVQLFDIERVASAYRGIKADIVSTTFECGGGEPTIHPQFPELLRLVSNHGPVDFPSNNSQDPARWLPRETAGRIFVRSALHPESEAKLDRYLAYARHLLDAGVDFYATYISHPTRLALIAEYRERFAAAGVPFQAVAFIGEHDGRRYPPAYTPEETHMLGLDGESRYWLHKIEPHVTRIRNYRGIPCIAGYRNIYIRHDGTMRRCMYDQRQVLEAPLQSAAPCEVKHCGCGMFLEKLNSVESVDSYNHLASKAGVAPVSIAWMGAAAEKLGYRSGSEAMAAEHSRMYDALMQAYAKDEIPE